MRATTIEFRLRMLICAAIIFLGFWAPWIEPLHLGRRISTLEWLALQLARTGLVHFTIAAPLVIALAALFAAIGMIFRVWGTAFIGPTTVNSVQMKSGSFTPDGPYRLLRNPLYLGLWFMVVALAFLMPPTGAVCAVVLITIFQLRLTLGEEAFLTTHLGEPYQAYLRAVPRFLPRLITRSALSSSGAKPDWLRAILAELTPIGVFLALAVFSWNYDSRLMIRVVLIAFGLSLVVRAFAPREPANSSAAE